MSKCECYHERIINNHPTFVSECWGTKECETCYCNGDTDNCTFYPEKRKEKKMTTAEMWTLAQKDGKVYIIGDMAYSKNHGFTSVHDFNDKWEPNNFNSIEEIMSMDEWKEMPNVMTKEEAEKKFGIHIV